MKHLILIAILAGCNNENAPDQPQRFMYGDTAKFYDKFYGMCTGKVLEVWQPDRQRPATYKLRADCSTGALVETWQYDNDLFNRNEKP